jgi:SAM-dependent methyltransferase
VRSDHRLTPADYRAAWERKPALRAVYRDYYKRMASWIQGGPTIEVGAGSANLKEALPQTCISDVVPSPWLDLALDAQALPFRNAAIANLVGVDVLHHFERPYDFLREAARVLRPGGRIVLVEPAITPLSWLIFKATHPEPVRLRADPFSTGGCASSRDPMDSNQALPTLLFARRNRARLQDEFPALRVVHRERLSLLAYPLTGGFRQWSLFPASLVAPTLRAEQKVAPVLAPLMAFRLFAVLERSLYDAADVSVDDSASPGAGPKSAN